MPIVLYHVCVGDRNFVRFSYSIFLLFQVKEILNERTKEETTLELDISVYDTERNEKAKKHRRELVRHCVM